MKRAWKSFDYTLLLPLLIVCTLGIIMVYSASSIVAITKYESTSGQFFRSQLRALIFGAFLFVILASVPYQFLKKRIVAVSIYAGGTFVLILVLVFGKVVNYAKSWLWGTQPSELIKLCVIIVIARFFAKWHEQDRIAGRSKIGTWGFLFLVLFLIKMQPDVGTDMLIAAIVGMMIFCSGIRVEVRVWLKRLALTSVIWVPLIYLIVMFGLSEEQFSRIETFFNPFQDPEGDGFHMINSFIAIASGGISGLGLGNSVQKYGYLPEPHTDFIMAIVSEELGFLGVTVILASLALIVIKAFKLAQRCKDPFGSMIAIGVGSMIGIQTFVNVGGVTGVLPLTGVPVPFVSSGGSSLVANLMAMGILANIASQVKAQEKRMKQPAPQKPHLVVVK